jgi:uncharacterized protein (DUF2147 family)
MRLAILTLIMVICSVALAGLKPDSIIGIWLTEKKDAKVEIYKQGGKYFGKIIWLREPTEKDGSVKMDRNNPDQSQHTKQINGLIIMKDFVFDGDEQWDDGTIYDPDNGKTYKCKIELEEWKMMKVRGYVGIPLFGRTEYWTRVVQ